MSDTSAPLPQIVGFINFHSLTLLVSDYASKWLKRPSTSGSGGASTPSKEALYIRLDRARMNIQVDVLDDDQQEMEL